MGGAEVGDARAGVPRVAATRLILLAVGLTVAALLANGQIALPREQTIHYVLGDEARRQGVEELQARWTPPGKGEDWTRAATFRYAPGQAPSVIAHGPRLPNGDYDVHIEIVANDRTSVVDQRVQLSGGTTSIDLGRAVRR